GGDPDRFLEDFFVAGDNLDPLFATRRSNLKKFLGHELTGDYNCIDGLALRTMSGYYIAMSEVFEITGQRTAALQLNTALFVESRDRDQFAIRCIEAAIAPIGGEKQPVVDCYIDGTSLEYIECVHLTCGEFAFNAVFRTSDD